MNGKLLLLPVVAVSLLALGACSDKEETTVTSPPATESAAPATAAPASAAAAQADIDFVNKAASSGLAEVEASRGVSEKTANATVREFADMMIKDHSAANSELTRLAGAKNIPTPTAPLPHHQEALTKVASAMGAESDRLYVEEFGPKAHREAIDLFEKQSRDGVDAELKAFASATLPKLKEHLEHAQRVADGLPKQ
jgi:putative membrane protein